MCMFRTIYDEGEAEVFVVVHMDNIIMADRGTATFKGLGVELHVKLLSRT